MTALCNKPPWVIPVSCLHWHKLSQGMTCVLLGTHIQKIITRKHFPVTRKECVPTSQTLGIPSFSKWREHDSHCSFPRKLAGSADPLPHAPLPQGCTEPLTQITSFSMLKVLVSSSSFEPKYPGRSIICCSASVKPKVVLS